MQFSLNVLWATLSSRKSGSRRPKDCVVRIPMTESAGCPIVSIGTNGDTWDLAGKEILWLFTAHTCACCGMRERELLCRLADSEEASESFFNLYPRLKAVESGAGDVRQIGRIEMMLRNGEAVSVGLDCWGECEMSEFKALASSLATYGNLEQYRLVGCNTSGHRRNAVAKSAQVEVDGVAVEEADRHMEELLEALATEKNVSSKSSERKREKKKKNSLKRHSNQGSLNEVHDVDGEAADIIEAFAQETSLLDQAILDAGIDSSLPCGESANFKVDEKELVRDIAHSVVEEIPVEAPIENGGSSGGKKKKRRSVDKEKASMTHAAGINTQPAVELGDDAICSGQHRENEIANARSSTQESIGEALLKLLKGGDKLKSTSLQYPEPDVSFASPTVSSEDANFAPFEGWSVVVGGRSRPRCLSQKSSCATDGSIEEPQSSQVNATASPSLLSHSESPCDKELANYNGTKTLQSVTKPSLVADGKDIDSMCSSAFVVKEAWDSLEREEDQESRWARVKDCFRSSQIESAQTKHTVVNVDKETQTDLAYFDAYFDSHSANLQEASIGDYKVDKSTSPFLPMKILPVVPRPACLLGWSYDPAKVLIPNLSVFPNQVFFDACLENPMAQLCLESPTELLCPEDPMEKLCLKNPMEHLCPENPMEHLFAENPMDHLCLENPLEHLFPEDPIDHLYLENPMEHLFPENPVEQFDSDAGRKRNDSDEVSESSTMCCLDEQCLRDPWDEQGLRDSWDAKFLSDAWSKCPCCP